jgi:hypothetical protein
MNTRYGRLTHRSSSRTGRERNVLSANGYLLPQKTPPVVHQLVGQGPDQSAVPRRGGRPFPEAPSSCSVRVIGFVTARDHIRQPLGLALVDEPMVQLHGSAPQVEATQFSISRALGSTSAASEKEEGRPVSWLVSANNRFDCSCRGKPRRSRPRGRFGAAPCARKDTEKKTILAQLPGDRDREKDGDGCALQMIKNGADSLIGLTSCPPIGSGHSTPAHLVLFVLFLACRVG